MMEPETRIRCYIDRVPAGDTVSIHREWIAGYATNKDGIDVPMWDREVVFFRELRDFRKANVTHGVLDAVLKVLAEAGWQPRGDWVPTKTGLVIAVE